MPPIRTGPITSAGQLTTELTYLRKCHADETTNFLSRIDPAIFASDDRVAMMQPLILGILEKQVKTDHLSITLSTSCPIINRDADEVLQGLHKPWLEDQDKRMEARVNEVKDTVATAYGEIKQDPSQPESKRSGHWSVRELAILHALYPILDHDYDAYMPILTGRTATQIANRMKHEHARGYLDEHQSNDLFKQAKAIHYKAFRRTATRLGLLEDRKTKRLASQTNVREPTNKVPLAYKTEKGAPNDAILTESSSPIAPKSTSRVEYREQSEMVDAEAEQAIPTEDVKPRRIGRPRKSGRIIPQKEETVSAISAAARPRAVPNEESELADTGKSETKGIETASRRRGRPRKNQQLDQPQPIESTSVDIDEGSIQSEGDDKKTERSISSEPTTPRRRGRPRKNDQSRVKKPETLPISSHSGKSTAGKKRSPARSTTTASSPGSPPNSACVAS